ncbi:GntR family transcriptional regulator [Nonomuraea sp. PA05]|uniref:GntR family transcriptional regulator n=1 Tax=Nonomuraea sp. PA05 TaxID=2604466 RepID=UPI0016523EC6|nr:GntR family transcriptional regulator [Nonomuraea sp. PA05]
MVSRHATSPLYRQVAEELQDRIGKGAYRPGDRLPSENDLSAEFAVNRLTVRRAIQELVRAGELHVRQGAGTFIAPPTMRYEVTMDNPRQLSTAEGLQRAIDKIGREVGEDLISAAPHEDADAREALGLGRAGLLRVETLLVVDRERWAVSSSYLEARRFPRLAARWGSHGGLYDVLREEYGVGLVYSWRSFTAVAADPGDAATLDVPPGSPLMVREGLSVDADGRPTVFVRRRCRGDRVKFVLRYQD